MKKRYEARTFDSFTVQCTFSPTSYCVILTIFHYSEPEIYLLRNITSCNLSSFEITDSLAYLVYRT
jgi:hypothetical protein